MFKSFLISMFAVFLFALGATGAWFYLNMSASEDADDTAPLASARAMVMPDPSPVPKLELAEELPAAVRGSAASAEEIFRLNLAQDAKAQQLRQQAEVLREHEQRIRTADTDTKTAQREVEGILAQITSTLAAAEKLFEEIKQASAQLTIQEQEMKKRSEELKALEDDAHMKEAAQIKTFAEFMQSMPAAVAAGTLKAMIEEGKWERAIQLLRHIEPRNVAKILAELGDTALISELATRYPEVNQLR